jgi:hypothetical protein
MTTKDNGGTAFPRADDVANSNAGMTLRDWFATHANEADIERYREFSVGPEFYYKYSREQARYRFADAMLEARK